MIELNKDNEIINVQILLETLIQEDRNWIVEFKDLQGKKVKGNLCIRKPFENEAMILL